MIGISSTYFAASGFGIYDSVAEAEKMGFGLVELGAAHSFEKAIPQTLKKIKRDFPGMKFTLHGVFPPMKARFWFNPSKGLTILNRKVVVNFFSAAKIVCPELISFHPGFSHEIFLGRTESGLNYPEYGKEIPRKKAFENAFKVFGLFQRLSEKTGVDFAIENVPAGGSDRPLFVSKEDFESAFSRFPNCGLLLDFGHALYSKKLEELLQLNSRVSQMHLHYSKPISNENPKDNHFTIENLGQLEQLSCIKQLNRIPLIFEHGSNVSREAVLKEKDLVESFLQKEGF